MIFRLTEYLKRRFIKEIRAYWQNHPHYPDLTDHIIGKYSFRERPSYGIVVKTGGGSHVQLSADNYMGTAVSYIHLARYQNKPGMAIEWVREDPQAIRSNNGRFPTPPGVYYVELTEDNEFYVDALLNFYNEILSPITPTSYSFQQIPMAGTVRIYEMPARFQLYEGINYTLEVDAQGKPTGILNLLDDPLAGGRYLVADYKHPIPSQGPFSLIPGRSDNKAIPGVVLAFGQRNRKGDVQAVMVDDIRRPSSLIFGGKWDISMDFDVMARDVYAQQEIADQTVIYLWGILRPQLSAEGIEMSEISLGGESEEVYDENGDDYFFNSSFSLTAQVDWEIHVPLSIFLRQITPATKIYSEYTAALPDDVLAQATAIMRQADDIGLELMRDPFFTNRGSTFETIR